MVSLNDGHAPTADYVRKLRQALPAAFPADLFYFQPADIATQILNFGLTAQIDVRTVGYDRVRNLRVAKDLRRRIARIPGVVDAHLQQEVDAPDFYVQVDRARAMQFGITTSDIGNNIGTSLSSSEQVSPNFWTDPTNGIPYYIAVQTPEYQVSSRGDLGNTPVSTAMAQPTAEPVPGELQNVATFTRDTVPAVPTRPTSSRYTRSMLALRARSRQHRHRYRQDHPHIGKQLAPGNTIQVTGQIDSMNQAFRDMAIGLLFAAAFVDLLMVVNYQNFGDPFVVILALPATFCGIVTMLYITGTTLSVPSLMCQSWPSASPRPIRSCSLPSRARAAVRRKGVRRRYFGRAYPIRPVLMTATAMIVGIIPMAIGGPGEEQNAALARAVIGGLLFATPTTLLVVPYLFATLRSSNDGKARTASSRRFPNQRPWYRADIEGTATAALLPPRPYTPGSQPSRPPDARADPGRRIIGFLGRSAASPARSA